MNQSVNESINESIHFKNRYQMTKPQLE